MGEPGKNSIRIPDLKDCQEVIDIFYNHGHKELDTARMYGEGTTEEVSARATFPLLLVWRNVKYLAKLDLKDCTIDTKYVCPLRVCSLTGPVHSSGFILCNPAITPLLNCSRSSCKVWRHSDDRKPMSSICMRQIEAYHLRRPAKRLMLCIRKDYCESLSGIGFRLSDMI